MNADEMQEIRQAIAEAQEDLATIDEALTGRSGHPFSLAAGESDPRPKATRPLTWNRHGPRCPAWTTRFTTN